MSASPLPPSLSPTAQRFFLGKLPALISRVESKEEDQTVRQSEQNSRDRRYGSTLTLRHFAISRRDWFGDEIKIRTTRHR